MRRELGVAVVALLQVLPGHGAYGAPEKQTGCTGVGVQLPAPEPGSRDLLFGVTAAGQVTAEPVDPDPGATIEALETLRGDHPFVVRINRVLQTQGEAGIKALKSTARSYTSRGFLVSLQLRYGDLEFEPTPEGYEAWVRDVVRALGPNKRVVGYEVTNEPNLRAAPDNSDGSFPGVVEALARGVAAVKDEARKRRFDHVQVGFDWFYGATADDDEWFWSELRKHEEQVAANVDWVGLNAYPGTFDNVPVPPGAEGDKMVRALNVLRNCFLPLVGIGDDTPIRVTENGYPTAFGRPELLQTGALDRMVRAVHEYAGSLNVTDYSWFTLRDAGTGGVLPRHTYGLMTMDFRPKEAFETYRGLIEELGSPGAG